MRAKGFTIIELIIVIALVALMALIVSIAVLGEIDKARGGALGASARMVYAAATTVILETGGATDEEYMRGLTGTVTDSQLRPAETRMSQRMQTLLEPNIVLAKEPGEGVSAVLFVIEHGEIVSTTYRAMNGSRYYAVTLEHGETTVTRENPPGE